MVLLNFPALIVLILSRLPQLLQFNLLLSRFESLEANFEKCVGINVKLQIQCNRRSVDS